MLGEPGQARGERLPFEFRPRRTIFELLASEKYFKWILITPLLLVLFAFMIYPFFYCVYYSAHDYDMVRPAKYIGLDNYRSVLRDVNFWQVLGRTFYVLVMSISGEIVLAMGIALLFNREFKGQNVIRGLCLLPLLISPLAMSMIWNFMLQYDFGVVNQFLCKIGFSKVMWWSPRIALYTITFISIWQWTPFSTFVLLSGLKGLPKDAFEAARVDGASPWFTFWKLTLPMLMPLIVIIILLRTMWLIRLFDPLFGTTRGGVNTETFDWMIYRVAFVFFDTGTGSTLAIISLFLTIIICALMFRVLMKAMGATK